MWHEGDIVMRREILGLSPIDEPSRKPPPWQGRAWLEVPVYVVEDTVDQLVSYIAPGAEFRFPVGQWPTPDGLHPWSGRSGWEGNGCLMVQRRDEHHAVWHFWDGPDREFACWYINLQTAFHRTATGYETQDLELDLVVLPDGSWTLKDDDVLDDRVDEGRFTPELARWVRGLAGELMGRLYDDDRWWDETWADWVPPPAWSSPETR
jgi:hypothetical protein